MFRAILTGVTLLVVTHSAVAVSDVCQGLLTEVQRTWTATWEGFPEFVYSPNGSQMLRMFGFTDTPELGAKVRDIVCDMAAAETEQELAEALGVPASQYGTFRLYYGIIKMQYRSIGMVEGAEYMANVFPTLLVALDEAGFPQWPLTKTYDEWLYTVTNLIDEVGPNFFRYLIPDLPVEQVPTFADPAFLARQLTDAQNLSDFVRRINVDFRASGGVYQVFRLFQHLISEDKVSETVRLVAALYDLVKYADSLSLLSLEEE